MSGTGPKPWGAIPLQWKKTGLWWGRTRVLGPGITYQLGRAESSQNLGSSCEVLSGRLPGHPDRACIARGWRAISFRKAPFRWRAISFRKAPFRWRVTRQPYIENDGREIITDPAALLPPNQRKADPRSARRRLNHGRTRTQKTTKPRVLDRGPSDAIMPPRSPCPPSPRRRPSRDGRPRRTECEAHQAFSETRQPRDRPMSRG